MPKNGLVENFGSPFFDNEANGGKHIVKVFEDTPIKTVMEQVGKASLFHEVLFVMTYGHFINVPELNTPEFKSSNVFLFDEFHETSGELIRAYELVTTNPLTDNPTSIQKPKTDNQLDLTTPNNMEIMIDWQEKGYLCPSKILFLSATPDSLHFAPVKNYVFPLPSPHKRDLFIRNGNVVDNYLFAADQEGLTPAQAASRTIIRVSTFPEIFEVITGLSEFNVKCQEVSSRTKSDKIDPTALLVCSQIIDSGYNLPNRDILVDNGMSLINVEGQMMKDYSSPSTAHQVMSRAGRDKPGKIYRPSYAGTGPKPKPYPSMDLFTSKLVSQYYKVHQLNNSSYIKLYNGDSSISSFIEKSGFHQLPPRFNWIRISTRIDKQVSYHILVILMLELSKSELIVSY
jgi:hypothetical protein